MQKSDIIALPNPHLRERSKKVGLITADIQTLIADMQDATLDWEDSREHELGVALAAIQVDRPLRIVIIRNDFDNKGDRSFSIFINPVITKYEGEIEEDYEGCLSVPDIYGKVPRYNKVRIRALDSQGREIRITAEGFLARVFQHEIDHTNGIVFIDHIKDDPKAFYHLKDDGHLEELDYEKDVRTNSILW
ncbi:MAG TPA: peptide deformylase [Bacillota bacterium]|nr:peptide deformylase [Bacillota bacterium]HSX36742.1 peptide deformylase [Patescibacteria group bacterium]